MKKYIYMAVAAIAALSSCSSDNDAIMEETVKQPLKFTASMESFAGTRATFNSEYTCAAWEVNDQILIKPNTDNYLYYYKAESAGLTTTFIPNRNNSVADPEAANYKAYFGCEKTFGAGYELPTLSYNFYETWAEGKFNMPMYAFTENGINDFKFKNLCGVLKIKVTDAQIAQVKSITLSSANKALSGTFTVDANNAAVLDEPNNTSKTCTRTYSTAVPTTAEGTVFYVALPAQTYQKLNIALNDGNGSILNMTTTAANITVERNKIYPITFNATSYAASFKVGYPDYDFTGFESSTLTASNAAMSVSLALSAVDPHGYAAPRWDERGNVERAEEESKLTITATPKIAGVTVTGLEYVYGQNGDRKVTKTDAGPWEFDVRNNNIYDGSTVLEYFYGIVVNYTK